METVINKNDLFNYLDGFTFGEAEEIEMAVAQFIEEKEGNLYYSDLVLAGELATEYLKNRNFKF